MIDFKDDRYARICIDVPKELYDALKRRLNDDQIIELLLQRLKDYAENRFPLPDSLVFAEFISYLNKKEKKIAQYPTEILEAFLQTLVDLAPTERWVLIKNVTTHFNNILCSSGIRKEYSGVCVGDILQTLGFMDRRRPISVQVLVRHDLLRHYCKLVKLNDSNIDDATLQ